MKNLQKGFAIPIIIAIVALLAIGGGAYIYINSKVEAPANIPDIVSNVPTTTPTSNTPLLNSQDNQTKTQESSSVTYSILTQTQAEDLVFKKWSDCKSGDCDSVKISFVADRGNQYLVTAIFTERDDSVSQTKREGLVIYNNDGSWVWSQYQPSPSEWRICHPGRGSQTFSTAKCF